MDQKSVLSLVENVLQNNPEVLSEVLAKFKVEPQDKLDKPQTIRLTASLRARVEKLAGEKRKEAAVIRKALEIGLTELEREG